MVSCLCRQGRKIKKITMKRLCLFLLIYLGCCPAWAETEPQKLTPAVRSAVYDAQQAMEKKEFLKAEECLKKYIRQYPKKPHYLVEFTWGNALTLRGKEREALSHYEAAADLYPDYAPIWQNIGKICFDLKQYEKAGDCLLKAYETTEKKDPLALYNVAVSYIMGGKEKKALAHLMYLSSGRAGVPKSEWLEAMLKVCMDLQLKEKAFELINRLLDKSGNDPRWWKILAQFHLQQNDYKKALTALTIYSYLTPINRKDIMLLGDLASTVGVPLKAGEYYEKALNFSNNPVDYEKLASAYIAAYKPEKAIQVLTVALKKKPTSGLWFMMGQVLYQKEDFDKAYNAFDQSACLDPGNGEAYLMMGYCALRIERKDTARDALQKACRFPKQHKMAKELLKHVAKEG
jgi:tetratricopeptide (TPR) repeat protein